jgi:hypothetical protein
METYLARSDRIIAQAEAAIAQQRQRVGDFSRGGNDAAMREAEGALALMVGRLEALRADRERVRREITRVRS